MLSKEGAFVGLINFHGGYNRCLRCLNLIFNKCEFKLGSPEKRSEFVQDEKKAFYCNSCKAEHYGISCHNMSPPTFCRPGFSMERLPATHMGRHCGIPHLF